MSDTNQYCPNCFRIITRYKECPYCKFDQFSRSNSMALPPNTKLNRRYILGRTLGSGGFGITYKAYDLKEQKICAIKEYVPSGTVSRDLDKKTIKICADDLKSQFLHGKKRFMDEANILQSLNYVPAVVKVFDYFDENNTCYFVMEYIEGKTLNQYRYVRGGKVPYRDLIAIFLDVAECLEKVHKKSIFHRDVSPENILIRSEDNTVRLIDFGNAKYISVLESQTMSIVLKPGFAPPEQYSSSSKQGSYTDVYGLASTFYFCLTGERVPSALGRLSGDSLKPIDHYLGEEYKDLAPIFDKALKLDSVSRTQTVGELIRQLEQFNEAHGIFLGKDDVTEALDDDVTEKIPASKIPPVKNVVRRQPYLDGIYGALAGFRYRIPSNVPITVGRGKECQIYIKGSGVISKIHFDIFYDSQENIFYLEDHSRNGTYINGTKCEHGKFYWLGPGSKITLANNACIFQVGVLYE